MTRLWLWLVLPLCACGEWSWEGHSLDLEICDTPAERSKGLQGHAPLTGNQGLLFVYPDDRTCSYWMKDVPFPIDLAFISSDGVVKEVVGMNPMDETPVPSPGKVRFVLEMSAGWFKNHNLGKGSLWQELITKEWTHAE